MLDLLTLAFSMGLQEDIQKETKINEAFDHAEPQEQTSDATNAVVETVEAGLNAVENAAVVAGECLFGSSMVSLPTVSAVVPVVDLSLPAGETAVKGC